MKRAIVFFILTAAIALAPLFVHRVPYSMTRIEASPQPFYELDCPSGTYPISPLTTYNPTTGKLRRNFCVDTSGNLVAGGTSNFLPVTLLNSGTNANSSTFWRGDGTWASTGYKVESVQFNLPAVAATVTETSLVSFTLPANELGANQVLRIRAFGIFSSSALPPNQTITLRAGGVGGTILGSANTGAAPANITNGQWDFQFYVIATAPPGAAVATWDEGLFFSTNFGFGNPLNNAVTISWATNAAQVITFDVTFSAATAGNSFQCLQFVIERVN